MTAMVAAVDPTDLKSLWRLINLFQAVDPSGNSIAHKALKEACSGERTSRQSGFAPRCCH
jgi:hypothetical protein